MDDHVGQHVLHRLEGADWPPEGYSVLGVFDGHLGVFPGRAHHLAAQQGSGPVQHRLDDGPSLVNFSHQGRPLDAVVLEIHPALLVLGQGEQRGLGNAGPVGVYQEQCDPLVGVRCRRSAAGYQAPLGHDEVVDEHLGAVQHPSVAVGGGLQLHGLWDQPRVTLGDRPGKHHAAV